MAIGVGAREPMRAKFQTPSNHIDNFQILALRKISIHRRMSLVNNRFSKFQNLRTRKQHTASAASSEGKRVSLITGKQMSYTPTTKRSRNYRRIQLVIYNYLERPTGFYAALYQVIMYFLALYFLPNLLFSVPYSLPNHQ